METTRARRTTTKALFQKGGDWHVLKIFGSRARKAVEGLVGFLHISCENLRLQPLQSRSKTVFQSEEPQRKERCSAQSDHRRILWKSHLNPSSRFSAENSECTNINTPIPSAKTIQTMLDRPEQRFLSSLNARPLAVSRCGWSGPFISKE